MRRTRSVIIPQPFATLACHGIIGQLASRWKVDGTYEDPTPVIIYAGPWTAANYDLALNYKVLLKGLGIRSRSLMPVNQWIGAAEVVACDWVKDANQFRRSLDFYDYDQDQDWQDNCCALTLSKCTILYHTDGQMSSNTNDCIQSKPVELLSKSQSDILLALAGERTDPWYSIV